MSCIYFITLFFPKAYKNTNKNVWFDSHVGMCGRGWGAVTSKGLGLFYCDPSKKKHCL